MIPGRIFLIETQISGYNETENTDNVRMLFDTNRRSNYEKTTVFDTYYCDDPLS